MNRYEDIKKGPTPSQIRNIIRTDFKINVSYWKSWKARDAAITMVKGSSEGSYELLPAYCCVLKQHNAGTVTFIQVDSQSRFKYLFIAFGQCIRAFPILRKVQILTL